MATRQYVGARYVPKFANPIEWSADRIYEPLEMVTYLNNTYTSKKPVPQGIEITNTEYWVITGNYNAQVEQYRQEVNEYKEETEQLITKIGGKSLKNNKFLLVGDSLNQTGGWGDKFREITSANCDVIGEGSLGFAQVGNSGNTVYTLVQNYVSGKSAEYLSGINIVVIAAGINDHNKTESDVRNGVRNAVQYIKENIPNSAIYIVIDHTFKSIDLGLRKIYNAIYDEACKNNAGCSTDSYTVCLPHMGWALSDKVHMNSDGYYQYAARIANYILTGDIREEVILTVNDMEYGHFEAGSVVMCAGKLSANLLIKTKQQLEANQSINIPLFEIPELANLSLDMSWNPANIFNGNFIDSGTLKVGADGKMRGVTGSVPIPVNSFIYYSTTYDAVGYHNT